MNAHLAIIRSITSLALPFHSYIRLDTFYLEAKSTNIVIYFQLKWIYIQIVHHIAN